MIRTDEPNADYHADTSCLSHSMLEKFIQSPQLYHGMYVTGTILHEETAAMRRGSLVHWLVLEADTCDNPYAIIDASTRATKAWKAGAAQANDEGLIPCTVREWEEAELIANAVLTHPLASKIFEACQPCKREVSVRWNDNGLMKKARLDLFAPDVEQLGGPVIIDLKTAANPSSDKFKWSVRDFGYDRQAAWYCDAAAAEWQLLPVFLFIVVGTSAPHDVYAYEMPTERIEQARYSNQASVEMFLACRDSDIWEREKEMEIIPLD